jgi:predicted NAD/FAD-dependent oxidoreductase
MSLFETVQAYPNASQLAHQLVNNANITYTRMVEAVQQDYQRFWYLNSDASGNPALTGPAPTGIQILQALGPQALSLMAIAWARVEFVAATAQAVGQSFDVNSMLPPYNLTWNQDGSLNDYSPRT